jgi:hypothetical protein
MTKQLLLKQNLPKPHARKGHTQGHACKLMTLGKSSSNAKKGSEPSKVGMGWMKMGPEKVDSRAQIARPP